MNCHPSALMLWTRVYAAQASNTSHVEVTTACEEPAAALQRSQSFSDLSTSIGTSPHCMVKDAFLCIHHKKDFALLNIGYAYTTYTTNTCNWSTHMWGVQRQWWNNIMWDENLEANAISLRNIALQTQVVILADINFKLINMIYFVMGYTLISSEWV